MSELKYLNRDQLITARFTCEMVIEDSKKKIHDIESGHPAFVDHKEVEHLANKVRGQTERLKWIDWYLETNVEKLLSRYRTMRGHDKPESETLEKGE